MSVERIEISLVDGSSGVPGVFQKRKCLRITVQAVDTSYNILMDPLAWDPWHLCKLYAQMSQRLWWVNLYPPTKKDGWTMYQWVNSTPAASSFGFCLLHWVKGLPGFSTVWWLGFRGTGKTCCRSQKCATGGVFWIWRYKRPICFLSCFRKSPFGAQVGWKGRVVLKEKLCFLLMVKRWQKIGKPIKKHPKLSILVLFTRLLIDWHTSLVKPFPYLHLPKSNPNPRTKFRAQCLIGRLKQWEGQDVPRLGTRISQPCGETLPGPWLVNLTPPDAHPSGNKGLIRPIKENQWLIRC